MKRALRRQLARLALIAFVGACDGPHEQAGENANAAAGIKNGPLSKRPNDSLGEIHDRTERDQKRAIEAEADPAEDRANEVRRTADQRADALEQQAAEI